MKKTFLAFVAIAITVGGYFYYERVIRKGHPYVAPRENADGTIDYTLIFRPLPKSQGRYWVLRFPKEWAVVPSESINVGKVQLPNGSVWDFKTVPNNWLEVRLDYPTLKPLRQGTAAQKDEVHLRARINPYLAMTDTDLQKLKTETERHCVAKGEVSPGVFLFETREPISEHEFKCFVAGLDIGHQIYDEKGNYIARFGCLIWKPNLARSGCIGDVELGNGYQAMVSTSLFEKNIQPAEVKQIALLTRDMFAAATVKHGKIPPYEKFEQTD
jgi:hypothetical protein